MGVRVGLITETATKVLMDDDHRIKPNDYSFPGLNISHTHKTLQTTEVSCKRHSLKRRPATKKQVLIQPHRVGRLRWAKARRFWTLKKWSTVIFSDECLIAVEKNCRVYVWKVGDEGS